MENKEEFCPIVQIQQRTMEGICKRVIPHGGTIRRNIGKYVEAFIAKEGNYFWTIAPQEEGQNMERSIQVFFSLWTNDDRNETTQSTLCVVFLFFEKDFLMLYKNLFTFFLYNAIRTSLSLNGCSLGSDYLIPFRQNST